VRALEVLLEIENLLSDDKMSTSKSLIASLVTKYKFWQRGIRRFGGISLEKVPYTATLYEHLKRDEKFAKVVRAQNIKNV
jgi:hypothetical protein